MKTNGCPVPLQQRPTNEYINFKNAAFFSWPMLPIYNFSKKLIKLWTFLCILIFPFTCTTYSISYAPFKTLLVTIGVGTIALLGMLTRLYIGWSYVNKRLMSPTVWYEESGWYDGEIWVKPPEQLTRERLISIYTVSPIINKIKISFGIIGVFCSFQVITFSFLHS